MRRALTTALFAVTALATFPALAAGGRVTVQVTVIHASQKGHSVDPRLKDLKRQLASFHFSAYKLLSQKKLTLGFGQSGTVRLPDGRTLEVTAQKRDAGGKLKVRLVIGKLLDTTYQIAQGGTLIVGGPKYQGGVLVLAVTQTAR